MYPKYVMNIKINKISIFFLHIKSSKYSIILLTQHILIQINHILSAQRPFVAMAAVLAQFYSDPLQTAKCHIPKGSELKEYTTQWSTENI